MIGQRRQMLDRGIELALGHRAPPPLEQKVHRGRARKRPAREQRPLGPPPGAVLGIGEFGQKCGLGLNLIRRDALGERRRDQGRTRPVQARPIQARPEHDAQQHRGNPSREVVKRAHVGYSSGIRREIECLGVQESRVAGLKHEHVDR
jgi:hypothetical protein